MNDDAQVLDLLHTLDRLAAPDHLEFPEGFDHPSARARASRLKSRLDEDFGQACTLDDQIQDASYYFKITVPAEATEAQVLMGVRLSNYGNLAVVTTPLPDSHDDLDHAVRSGAVSEADRRLIEAALTECGYTSIPPRLLHRPYDGVTPLADERFPHAAYGPHQARATWWTRYFEHL
ncbi:hypothetical protein SAMN05216532_0046 [Streptomyces sp. 2231.1]|uniref:hypothetical protein n=1 Tax=Streptomyces sp. 2231.1 TaxID=1855347 RepID=UPI000895EDC9|nr:hypothetical protein [Streptomyces sp. 2231.1]SEB96614.1 hypothetical protein SAMN05216532_0046 [Streptomyces sp. 2231.1]